MKNQALAPIDNINVLIIDDDPDLREIIAIDLQARGFNTDIADSGVTGLEAMKKSHFDVVVCDIRMKNMGGVEFLQNAKAKNITSPAIIFITGFSDENLEDIFQKGAEGYFTKPFNRRQLVSHIHWILTDPKSRWSRQHDDNVQVNLQKEFDNFEKAIELHQFNLGRGGFFIATDVKASSIPETLNFDLKFKQGPVSHLKGQGVVRWVREKGGNIEKPKGIGIEIVQLEDKSIKELISFHDIVTPLAYIPKS